MAIIWYGERGVVNTLVLSLFSDSARSAERCQQLLSAVRWAGGSEWDWIGSIERVIAIAEVGLADFGNPDLILVASCRDGARRAVFIEAKVVRYVASALPNVGGMSQAKGFNSSINGQLALRYRFAHGLAAWTGRSNKIVEPASLYEGYRKPRGEGLEDTQPRPRRLAKAGVLDLLQKAGLAELPAEHTFFVALTWDDGPFFGDAEVLRDDLLPLILDLNGNPAWEHVRARMGWLGFEAVCMALKPSDTFESALATMVKRSAPAVDVTAASVGTQSTTNLREFGQDIHEQLGRLEATAKLYFDHVERHNGSSSVKLDCKVRIKLVPVKDAKGEAVLLGISAHEAPLAWSSLVLTGPRAVNNQPFYFARLPSDLATAVAMADGVFQDMLARYTDRPEVR